MTSGGVYGRRREPKYRTNKRDFRSTAIVMYFKLPKLCGFNEKKQGSVKLPCPDAYLSTVLTSEARFFSSTLSISACRCTSPDIFGQIIVRSLRRTFGSSEEVLSEEYFFFAAGMTSEGECFSKTMLSRRFGAVWVVMGQNMMAL